MIKTKDSIRGGTLFYSDVRMRSEADMYYIVSKVIPYIHRGTDRKDLEISASRITSFNTVKIQPSRYSSGITMNFSV